MADKTDTAPALPSDPPPAVAGQLGGAMVGAGWMARQMNSVDKVTLLVAALCVGIGAAAHTADSAIKSWQGVFAEEKRSQESIAEARQRAADAENERARSFSREQGEKDRAFWADQLERARRDDADRRDRDKKVYMDAVAEVRALLVRALRQAGLDPGDGGVRAPAPAPHPKGIAGG